MENIRRTPIKKPRPVKNTRQEKTQREKAVTDTRNNAKGASESGARNSAASDAKGGTISIQGMSLNAETARKAIILSEIIGPPVSKRRRDNDFISTYYRR